MHLNQALFDVNGGCGYVLRPPQLVDPQRLASSTSAQPLVAPTPLAPLAALLAPNARAPSPASGVGSTASLALPLPLPLPLAPVLLASPASSSSAIPSIPAGPAATPAQSPPSTHLNAAALASSPPAGSVDSRPRSLFDEPIALTITIISAQQLPRPNDTVATDTIRPSVHVQIVSPWPEDAGKARTPPARAHSFNALQPTWKHAVTFSITRPEFCFVRFNVIDGGATMSALIGTYAVLLSSIEQGYRHVPLNNAMGERLRFSTLFVHVAIAPLDAWCSGSKVSYTRF
nr:hypothetical protein HK105_000883 [Polyrhizophydium stewartii]